MRRGGKAKGRTLSAGSETCPAGRRHRQGFTLLELIVVLAIAAVAVAVVPPLIAQAIPGTQLKGAAREVAAGLRYARNRALTSDEEAVLMLDIKGRKFSVSGRKRQYPIPDGLDLTLLTAESEMRGEKKGGIRFFPDGGSTGGRISLATSKRQYDVDVDWLTGKVRILESEPDS